MLHEVLRLAASPEDAVRRLVASGWAHAPGDRLVLREADGGITWLSVDHVRSLWRVYHREAPAAATAPAAPDRQGRLSR